MGYEPRCWHRTRECFLFGLEGRSLDRSRHSARCGVVLMNTTRLDLLLYTKSASRGRRNGDSDRAGKFGNPWSSLKRAGFWGTRWGNVRDTQWGSVLILFMFGWT